jgi:hypothetical protein
MREGKLNWANRKNRQKALLDAVLERDEGAANVLLKQDIEDELNT